MRTFQKNQMLILLVDFATWADSKAHSASALG